MSEKTKNPETESPEKKENGEKEPVLNLKVHGPCNNPEGDYIGLRKTQRDDLGVKEGDKVVVVDSEGKEKVYTVGKGSKNDEIKKDPELFTVNGIKPGEKVTVKKYKEDKEVDKDKDPVKDISEKTRKTVAEKFGEATAQHPKEGEHSSGSGHGKEAAHEKEATHDKEAPDHKPAEHNEKVTHEKEPAHENQGHEAEHSTEEPKKKEGFFRKTWASLKKLTGGGNEKDSLGFARQGKPDVAKRSIFVTPFLMAGDIIDGTVLNVMRRFYEIGSPIVNLPKALKGKKFTDKVKTIYSTIGQTIGAILKTPILAANEAYIDIIQKPIARVGKIVDMVPVFGPAVSSTANLITKIVGKPLLWLGQIQNGIETYVKTGGAGSGHGGHGGNEEHGAAHGDEHAKGEHEAAAEHGSAAGHGATGHEAAAEHEGAADEEEATESTIEGTEKTTEGAENKGAILAAIKSGKYGASPANYKTTVGKYLNVDTEVGKITVKEDADLIALSEKLTKSDGERQRWKDTGVKLIKFIRKNGYNGGAIRVENLNEFGFVNGAITLLSDAIGEEELKQAMEMPLKQAA
jgi:hypothetical protein